MTAAPTPSGREPDPYLTWDAAYVLGALGPADRREYEAHLAGCAACREAVGEIAGVPGILGTLPADQAIALPDEAPPTPRADVVPLGTLARSARRARVRRRSLAAVAAAALAVGGVLTGMSVDGGAAVDPPVVAEAADVEVELEPVGATDVHASLTATERPWGTLLAWSCRYGSVPEGYESLTYELVVVDRAGGRTVAATWGASGDSAEDLRAASAVELTDVVRLEIAVVGGTDPLASADV
ncbi:zf-HC2 domain-containing protein [Isoptericola halotolerans]|uniref:Putative zinc-finger domain-containing protein n=1 Tax=Isoptericola halotolerans TaxID=300560 RepID=A0ABX2A9H8_9MICO|nr:zf-HC2 domain-containing protein [Isoptericola halotolerans]NOV98431.1 hypothetical protein [Isoptericola halotolerans]